MAFLHAPVVGHCGYEEQAAAFGVGAPCLSLGGCAVAAVVHLDAQHGVVQFDTYEDLAARRGSVQEYR
jgi:hypothetical protein